MWSFFRLFILFLLPIAVLTAQDQPPAEPASSPIPTDSPAEPASSPDPSATPAAATPEESSEAATPGDTPAPDTIPMAGEPTSTIIGAPLDTNDLAPADQALPDEAFTLPNAIIPDELPPAPAIPAESEEEKERQLGILYREVRIRVEKDPDVQSLHDQAGTAKTMEDRRAAFREYYRLLFKKMVAVDKNLEVRCTIMEEAYLRRLAQERIEPTIPLNPPPTPEPLN